MGDPRVLNRPHGAADTDSDPALGGLRAPLDRLQEGRGERNRASSVDKRVQGKRVAPRATRAGAAFLALAVAAAAVMGLGPATVAALFGDAASVPSNSFASASCWAAVKSLQKGTAVNSANGTQTIGITAVDPAKSFLIFNTRSSSDRPVAAQIRGRIASSTTIEFARNTDEGSPAEINIQWYVVEYPCGVNVQRGETTLSSTVQDVPITPVGSLSRAFTTWSKTSFASDTTTDDNDEIVAELTSTSNLQLRTNVAASDVVWWQVIEFTSAADINVQRGTTAMLGAAMSATITIPTPVDTSKTFILVSFQTSGQGVDIGARMLRAELTNSSTITVDRAVSGTPDDITEIFWQAIELTGASVRRGTESFASGTAQRAVGLTPSVDTARTVAFSSVELPGGASGGSAPYVTDDVQGVASFTAAVSASQLTLDRDSTVSSADVGWFVVQLR